ncbi:MAG: glycosyltransferase [Candidatus Diapherotrites archaeon]|nr:glycosyltransferase [Candidatus Diapherotrites archaeon]
MVRSNAILSIVVPSRNEEKNIRECLEALEEAVPLSSIVVVDRSEDSTPKLVEELSKKYGNVKLVRFGKPGKGAALKEGFRRAEKNSILVMTDADGSYPAEEIPKMINLLKKADVVIGSRYCPGGKLKEVPFARRITGKIYSFLFHTFFGVYDPQSGLKVFRKQVLDKIGGIPGDGFEWDSAFIARAKRAGFRVVEYPISYIDRKKESNVNIVKTSWSMWVNLIQLLLGFR